jgi:hypothetical protein
VGGIVGMKQGGGGVRRVHKRRLGDTPYGVRGGSNDYCAASQTPFYLLWTGRSWTRARARARTQFRR